MNFLRTICVCGALALPGLLSAASSGQNLQVHVPFSFVVAGQEFTPGNYRIHQDDNGIVVIQGQGKAAMALSSPGYTGKSGVPSSLQFTGDGGHEYLVGVRVQGEANRALPAHPEENRKLTLTSTR